MSLASPVSPLSDDAALRATTVHGFTVPAFLTDRRVQIGGAVGLALAAAVIVFAFSSSKTTPSTADNKTVPSRVDSEPAPSTADSKPVPLATDRKAADAPAKLEPKPGEAQPASAPTPPNPRVDMLSDQVRISGGALPRAKALAAVEKSLPALERCYEQALKRKPALSGRLVYTMQVKTSGYTAGVKQLRGTINDKRLIQCSADALKKTPFARPKKRAAQVTVPFDYSQ